ncbi:MAG: hypothetical protein RL329_2177 [Bacteroidota bacterium]|jgi:hypothetical protein
MKYVPLFFLLLLTSRNTAQSLALSSGTGVSVRNEVPVLQWTTAASVSATATLSREEAQIVEEILKDWEHKERVARQPLEEVIQPLLRKFAAVPPTAPFKMESDTLRFFVGNWFDLDKKTIHAIIAYGQPNEKTYFSVYRLFEGFWVPVVSEILPAGTAQPSDLHFSTDLNFDKMPDVAIQWRRSNGRCRPNQFTMYVYQSKTKDFLPIASEITGLALDSKKKRVLEYDYCKDVLNEYRWNGNKLAQMSSIAVEYHETGREAPTSQCNFYDYVNGKKVLTKSNKVADLPSELLKRYKRCVLTSRD